MSMQSTGNQVVLPPGVTIGPGRETSQINAQNQVLQGLVFPITLADGTVTSVFIPYAQIHNTAAVQAVIDARIAAIQSITLS